MGKLCKLLARKWGIIGLITLLRAFLSHDSHNEHAVIELWHIIILRYLIKATILIQIHGLQYTELIHLNQKLYNGLKNK